MKILWKTAVIALGIVMTKPSETKAAPATRQSRVDRRDELGRTALMLAARAGDLTGVQKLLRAGAAVEDRSRGRWTPLMYAVSKNHLEVARLLLQRGANPRVRGLEGTSALGSAWERGSEPMLEALVRAGADLNNPRENLLGNAASLGRLDLTATLLRLGARPEGSHPLNRPLEQAIRRRNTYGDPKIPQLVALLLKAGAKPRQSDLTLAIYLERIDPGQPISELLLHAGVDIQGGDFLGWTPLHHAVLHRNVAMAERLLKAGAKTEAEDQSHRTPLDMAVAQGDATMVKLLVRRGAKVGPRAARSPLATAAAEGHAEIVRILREAGATVGLEAERELARAARRLNVPAVTLLLEVGADPNFNEHGWTPLGLALGGSQVPGPHGGWADAASLRAPTLAIARLLLAVPTLAQAAKDDALRRAAGSQPLEILRMLVDAGANPDREDEGGSARKEADRNPDPAVAAWLRER